MPGWVLETEPKGFGWGPDRHLRAVLSKDGRPTGVVIRCSWCASGFEIEKFLYERLLSELPVRTATLLAVFSTDEDEALWMVLEDMGKQVAAGDAPGDRRLFLEALGRLHGYGRCLIDSGRLIGSPIRCFPKNHSYFEEWPIFLEMGLEDNQFGLPEFVLETLFRLRDELARSPRTLLHGDTDFSNAIRLPSAVGLIDWERSSIGPASVDLGGVVDPHAMLGEMESYRKAFNKYAESPLDAEEAVQIARAGIVFASLRWVCYYVGQVSRGNDPGDDWRRRHYEPCLEKLRAATETEGYWRK
jgi:hypothetical protein